jgi:uncharacterized membrane protein YtjA (UPF0391 family)
LAATAGLEAAMFHYAVAFLVIALIAAVAVFGFGGIAAAAAGIATIGAVIGLLAGRSRV